MRVTRTDTNDTTEVDWDKQIQSLVDIGYSLPDAENSVRWVRQEMDQYSNVDEWVPTSEQLDDLEMEKATLDAEAYFDAPNEYQRILHARSSN